MLRNFLATVDSKVLPVKAKHNGLDVTLSKEGTEFYAIQVTKYGQCTNNIVDFSNNIFGDLITAELLPNYTPLATVYSKSVDGCKIIRDLRYERKCLSLSKNTNDKDFLGFPLWREYLSFRLKHKLISRDSEEFKEIVLSEFTSLQAGNPYTKFTYQQDGRMVYNNCVPLDENYKSCQALSVALTNVIKQSLSTEFIDGCLAMLEVDNPNQTETALMVKLLPMINENYRFE